MKWWDRMPWSSFSEYWALSQLFHSPLSLSSRGFLVYLIFLNTYASLTTLKPLTQFSTTNCGKFWKRWEYKISLSASWETCMQVKKQQLEPDMKQWTGSKLEKEYVKAVYCHPAHLTSMQSTSCEVPAWMKCQLESRLLREISTTSDMQMTPP